jgi:hypothetical protein
MKKILISLLYISMAKITTAQITIGRTFQDSVYAVASDSIYNEISILGARVATALNNVELISPKGREIKQQVFKAVRTHKTCDEVYQLCQFDTIYLTHSYNLCKIMELSKLERIKYPYARLPRYASAISEEHTRLHPEVFQMYRDSHNGQD